MLAAVFHPFRLRPGLAVLGRAVLLGLLAFLVRVAFVLDFAAQPLFDINLVPGTDMEVLVAWARRVAGGDLLGRGSGPFWWAPLFPYTLGGVLALLGRDNLLGAALAQAVLGAMTTALLYLLGRRLFDEATGFTAGLLAAVYGPSIFYTGVLLSTTLEVFLSVAILLTVTAARAQPTPARWLGAGIVAGLGCLARPNFLIGIAVLWVLLPVLLRSQHDRVRSPRRMKTLVGGPESATPTPALPPAWGRGGWGDSRGRPDAQIDRPLVRRVGVMFALGVALVIAPVTVRNWAVGGRAVLVSEAGPETFRIANSYDSTPLNFVYPKKPQMPFTSVAFWRHQARKAVLFWWGFEPPQNVNYYLAREISPVLRLPWLSFWLAVPLAVIGLWATRSRARSLAHVYAFLGAYYVSIVAFFIIARWRLSLVVPLLLFTAAGLLTISRWIMARRWWQAMTAAAAVVALVWVIYPGPGPFIFPADRGQLGYILANRGDYAGAAKHLARAVAGIPQDARLWRDLGIFLHKLGRPTEARAALERAVILDSNDAVAHHHLGRLLLDPGGDPERARVHLTRALTLAPEGRGAAEARALLTTLDRRGRAP